MLWIIDYLIICESEIYGVFHIKLEEWSNWIDLGVQYKSIYKIKVIIMIN